MNPLNRTHPSSLRLGPLLIPAALACLAPALPAQVLITPAGARLAAGTPCLFTAEVASSSQPSWQWRVREAQGGTIVGNERGQGLYTPPAGLVESAVFHIQVVRPGTQEVLGETAVTVAKAGSPAAVPVEPAWFGPRLQFLAGDPAQDGHVDGKGAQARFGAFVDDSGGTPIRFVPEHPDPRIAGSFLMADVENHAIRVLKLDGTVWTWLGGSGEVYQDGRGTQARFYAPQGLAIRPAGDHPWQCVIADTHNNLIRSSDAEGNVTTLAGVPADDHDDEERGGWRDGLCAEALFKLPLGVAMDRDGVVYVADTGNRAIRRIAGGRVTTLAGDPRGGWEIKDGLGGAARFRSPAALVLDEQARCLYVTDHRAVRRVALEDGRVTTLAGCGEGGFEAWQEGKELPEGPTRMAGIPCFANLAEVCLHQGKLYLADPGNQAIRVLELATGFLTTLAGHPTGDDDHGSHPELRWGPLRDGRELASGPWAAVGYPQGIALDGKGNGLVAMTVSGAAQAKESCVVGRMELHAPLPGGQGGGFGQEEHKGEHKAESKAEPKAEPRAEPKGEAKGDPGASRKRKAPGPSAPEGGAGSGSALAGQGADEDAESPLKKRRLAPEAAAKPGPQGAGGSSGAAAKPMDKDADPV